MLSLRRVGRDCRPRNSRQGLQHEARHGHQRAGVAGRDSGIGLAAAHRIDGEPHAALAAALAQSLARLGIHGDEDIGVENLGTLLQLRVALQQRRNAAAIADQEKAQVRMPDRRQGGARNHHVGAKITPHDVQRDGQMLLRIQGIADGCPNAGRNGEPAALPLRDALGD
jgi:hypothetical protein